jgi:hypothetical protein
MHGCVPKDNGKALKKTTDYQCEDCMTPTTEQVKIV